MKRGRAKKNGELNHEDKYPLHGISPTRVRVRGCKVDGVARRDAGSPKGRVCAPGGVDTQAANAAGLSSKAVMKTFPVWRTRLYIAGRPGGGQEVRGSGSREVGRSGGRGIRIQGIRIQESGVAITYVLNWLGPIQMRITVRESGLCLWNRRNT